MSDTITLYAHWPGELAAGIRSGSEVITIRLEYGQFEPEDVEALRSAVREMFDAAAVLTQGEQNALDASQAALNFGISDEDLDDAPHKKGKHPQY